MADALGAAGPIGEDGGEKAGNAGIVLDPTDDENFQREHRAGDGRAEIAYKRPAKLGDWLIIRGRLAEVSRARFWRAFEMIRETDGALLVTARQALALVQMPEGKPARLPAGWLQRWG